MSDVRINGVKVEITPQQFWRHGYRWGYSDGWHRLPNMLDDQSGDELADVNVLSARKDGGHA